MDFNSLVALPEKPITKWALLIIPCIGAFMTTVIFEPMLSNNSIWATLITRINPWPISDWRGMFLTLIQATLAFLPILIVSGGFVWLSSRIPLLHPISQYVRQDWSLLSYFMYGAAFLPVMLATDEYHGLSDYFLASLAILVIGALAYMRPAKSWSRLFTLLRALGLSFSLLGFGKYLVYPQQTWVVNTTFPRWWEAVSTLTPCVALTILMIVPVTLELLPRGKNDPESIHLEK